MRWRGKRRALGRDAGSQLSWSRGSCLRVLGQPSLAAVNLSITSYHPARQPASPRLGPSAGPHGSRGKRKQERESCLQGGFDPSPLAARQARVVPGAGLLSCWLYPRVRHEGDPPSPGLADSLLGSKTVSILGLAF